MYLQTMLELSHMTDDLMFEWMMCDLLSFEGYKGIDPQNPGTADNGKDAIYYDNGNAIVFAFSIQKTWRKKFKSDFASALRQNPDMKGFVFGSNQRLFPAAKDAIKAEKAKLGIKVDFYDAGRIKVLLDTHYKKLRQIYLHIQDNTTIRRKVTNVLFDPENEVQLSGRHKMFNVALPNDMIGLFTLIKDEDLTAICETEDELAAFKTALNTMMHYRRLAGTIDNHIFNTVLNDYQIKSGMPNYYHKILDYCNARLRGEDKQKVEDYVTIAGYLGPTNEFCEQLYERLLDNQELKVLLNRLEAIHQECMRVRESILALPGFRLETQQVENVSRLEY
jgi:hypothetical protein